MPDYIAGPVNVGVDEIRSLPELAQALGSFLFDEEIRKNLFDVVEGINWKTMSEGLKGMFQSKMEQYNDPNEEVVTYHASSDATVILASILTGGEKFLQNIKDFFGKFKKLAGHDWKRINLPDLKAQKLGEDMTATEELSDLIKEKPELGKAWSVLDDAGVDDAIRRNPVRVGEISNYLTKNPGTEAAIKQGLDDAGQYKDEFLNGIKNATEDLSHLNGRSALPNEISDAVVKIKQHRNSTGNISGGNYGYLEGNVNGNSVDNKMWRSGEAKPDVEPQIFEASEVGGWLRNTDSEYKMLNRLASDLGGQR